MKVGGTPKPSKGMKRASFEWAKAFVSHRKISDANYHICDDLVTGKGSEIRSAILKALADVRVLPRVDQVHVDTKTAGQIIVFISESQDVGTLIPSPDALADSLMQQAKHSRSRLCFNLDGYIITSASRIPTTVAPEPKPKSPIRSFNPLQRLHSSPLNGSERPHSMGAGGEVSSNGGATKPAARLSRIFSRRPP